MDFIEQQNQESKHIKEELVNLNLKTPYLSEASDVINKILANLPSQFLNSKIKTSFYENFDEISMNSRIEVAKFEPGPLF